MSPLRRQNAFGYLAHDQRHALKVNVTTQIPLWNVRLGAAFSWVPGTPYSIAETHASTDQPRVFGTTSFAYNQVRTSFPSGERNDQRSNSYRTFDVSIKKDFTPGKATSILPSRFSAS